MRFTLNRAHLPMSKIVLTIITDLLRTHTFDEINGIFPTNIVNPWVNTLKIVDTEKEIRSRHSEPNARYYMENKVVDREGKKCFVNRMWDSKHSYQESNEGSFLRFKRIIDQHIGNKFIIEEA